MPFLTLYMLKEISFEEHVSSRNLGMDLVSVVLRLKEMPLLAFQTFFLYMNTTD